MRIIVSNSLNPYFNLAAEAYFLQQTDEEIILIWQSENAVVCGKHQNICAEIDFSFCLENGILPARRLSGGGTVFHDLGNVNFTFIQNLKQGLDKAVNYKQFLDPIRRALSNLNIQTTYSQRDDLLLEGFKISGNAQHIYQQKKRVLHHGTLLYDSNLSNLSEALHTKGSYEGKAIKSVRSQVANIRKFVDVGTTKQFIMGFLNEIEKNYGQSTTFNEYEVQKIQDISNEKFSSWDWILGYSPKYIHSRKLKVQGLMLLLNLTIDKGIIQSIDLKDFESFNLIYSIECSKLLGQEFSIQLLREVFPNWTISEVLQLF